MRTLISAVLIGLLAGVAAFVHKTYLAERAIVLDVPVSEPVGDGGLPQGGGDADGEALGNGAGGDPSDGVATSEGAESAEPASPAPEKEASSNAPREIGVEEAFEMYKLALEGRATIIDARPRRLYEEGHIPMAINLPLSAFSRGNVPEAMDFILPDMPIMLYCTGADCDESRNVAIYLNQLAGVEWGRMRIFTGGWPAWEAAGHQVETGAGPW